MFLSPMTFSFVDTAQRAAISDWNHCIFNKSNSNNVTFCHTSIKLTDCTNCTEFETQTKLNKLNFNKNANTIGRGDRTNKIKVQSLKINTIVSGSMSDFSIFLPHNLEITDATKSVVKMSDVILSCDFGGAFFRHFHLYLST